MRVDRSDDQEEGGGTVSQSVNQSGKQSIILSFNQPVSQSIHPPPINSLAYRGCIIMPPTPTLAPRMGEGG